MNKLITNGQRTSKRLYIFIPLVIISLTAAAQQEIVINEALNHVGDSVKICSRIYGGKYLENSKGSPTLLNMGGNYPDAPLTLVIWKEAREQFKRVPEKLYGKQVCVLGVVELYKGKPQIVIKSPDQIQEEIKVDVR